jgi:hypothetical protein
MCRETGGTRMDDEVLNWQATSGNFMSTLARPVEYSLVQHLGKDMLGFCSVQLKRKRWVDSHSLG